MSGIWKARCPSWFLVLFSGTSAKARQVQRHSQGWPEIAWCQAVVGIALALLDAICDGVGHQKFCWWLRVSFAIGRNESTTCGVVRLQDSCWLLKVQLNYW